jgi:hypothetical protein
MLTNSSNIQLGRVNTIGTIANPSIGGVPRSFNVTPIMIKPAVELQQARIAISLASGQNEVINRNIISNITSSHSLNLSPPSMSNGSSSPNSPTATSSLSFTNYFNNADQSFNTMSPNVLECFKTLISTLQQQQTQPLTPTSPQLPISGTAVFADTHLNTHSNQSQIEAVNPNNRASEKRVKKINNYVLIETNNNLSNESFNMAFNTSNKRFFHWKVS